MSDLLILLLPLFIYAIPLSLGLLGLKVLFPSRFREFPWPGYLAPISVWIALAFFHGRGKSLTNLIFDPIILATITTLLTGILLGLREQPPRNEWGTPFLFLGCFALGFLVYFLVPALPE